MAMKKHNAALNGAKKPRRSAARKRGESVPAENGGRYYYKGNRHKQLRAFVSVVKLGTLTRAAEALYLSQPTISLQLQALERELGMSLLERRRRRINLTDAGEALYELARPLVEGWDTLDRDFQARVKGLQAGRLTIAAGTSTIQYLLPDLVRRYRERFPAVQLQLANVTGKDGMAMLRADEADFAVGSMLDVPNDIAWAPVQHYDPMLIMRSYGVVMRKGKFLSAEARAFIDLVRPGLLTHREHDDPGHSQR